MCDEKNIEILGGAFDRSTLQYSPIKNYKSSLRKA